MEQEDERGFLCVCPAEAPVTTKVHEHAAEKTLSGVLKALSLFTAVQKVCAWFSGNFNICLLVLRRKIEGYWLRLFVKPYRNICEVDYSFTY